MTQPQLIAEPLTRIRPSEMEWEPLGTHGIMRKKLGGMDDVQFATSLVHIPVGWHGGGIAHFHNAFEEVFMLEGSVTVGGSHYWQAGDYFFRPGHVVHGHDERAEEGALALIRADGPLSLQLVHEPAEPDEYKLPEYQDGRGHLYSLQVADVAWVTDASLPADWRIKPLSENKVNGARTFMVKIPAGWTRNADAPTARDAVWEACILQGSVIGEKAEFLGGDYSSGPAGTEIFGIQQCDEGAEAIVWMFAPNGEA
jgi:quercetin dioxygenase-like cupin family protein